MRTKTWLVLAIGFGTLIGLIGLLGFGAMRRAKALHEETVAAHASYLQTDAALRDMPADLYLGGILIRDYLLDPSHLTGPSYREQMRAQQASGEHRLALLTQQPGAAAPARIQDLSAELKEYWRSMEPILDWSPAQKAALSHLFLRQQVLPRREAVADLARDISEINAANLRKEQQRLEVGQQGFQGFLQKTLAVVLALGMIVAVISIARVEQLERRGQRERERAEHAEEEMRRLSRSLVRTQEEERRSLSRELHDAVGQMLSAMTMELGNLESAMQSPEKLRQRLEEARRLNADTIRGVRDLAMGLRPSMLDELGLGPALRWQGREFSRRSGIPVTVQLDGDLEGLPDAHRTCIYRIVQEALTNCARHAQATNIRVAAYGHPSWVRLTIQDDGVGFEPENATSTGLGLIGIQERAGGLDGQVNILSQPGKGTILEVEVPVNRVVHSE